MSKERAGEEEKAGAGWTEKRKLHKSLSGSRGWLKADSKSQRQ